MGVVERVEQHEHVVVGAVLDVVPACSRAIKHHGREPCAVRRPQLCHQFIECHRRHECSPVRAAAATTESASSPEPAKASSTSTAEATATEATASPSSATPSAAGHEPEQERKAATSSPPTE